MDQSLEAPVIELVGTWEEITARAPDFHGKRLRVIVLEVDDLAKEELGVVERALEEIWRTVPDESWEQFPADFGDDMDHYLYGTPRK